MNPKDALYKPYIKAGWSYVKDEATGAFLWFDENGVARCGAKKANKDEVCKQHLLQENGRCRKHGGEVLKGANHPSFKTGLYSKHLPSKLALQVDELLQDERLMDLRQNAALTDVRLAQVLESLNEGELSFAWLHLRDLIKEGDDAIREQKIDTFALFWKQIKSLVDEGAQQYLAWSEIHTLNERKRKLVETSEKVSLLGERSISVADHLAIITAITTLFLNHTKDEQTRRKVLAEIQRVVS